MTCAYSNALSIDRGTSSWVLYLLAANVQEQQLIVRVCPEAPLHKGTFVNRFLDRHGDPNFEVDAREQC